MKYRTIEEILDTPAEHKVKQDFISCFGEKLGTEIFEDFKKNHKDRYELMLERENKHKERMRELATPKPKTGLAAFFDNLARLMT